MDRLTGRFVGLALGLGALLASGSAIGTPLDLDTGSGASEPAPFLQCVPYARQVSGIQLFGDAHTWWDQAAGRYGRGREPKVGAVMSFRPYGSMVLGHVAAVSRVIDSRTVLLRHSNWSPINGRRGQIEDGVRAIDVSPDNDWSEVRVWFAPLQALGTTRWPINGFIYPQKARGLDDLDAPAARASRLPLAGPTEGDDFATLFAGYPRPSRAAAKQGPRSAIGADFLVGIPPERSAGPAHARTARRLAVAVDDDPIGRIIASRVH